MADKRKTQSQIAADSGTKKKRMTPTDRDAQIIRETIRFFADVGMNGQTRELAQRLNITQPLLYRYFPTKQHLIERVYKEVFDKSWKPEWKTNLQDRTVSLRERLINFYSDYTSVIFNYEWMRIYMYSGLAGAELNKKYIRRLEGEILRTICIEQSVNSGKKEDQNAITKMKMEKEMEKIWNLHGGIFYYGVRKYIYQIKVPVNLHDVIVDSIDKMLECS